MDERTKRRFSYLVALLPIATTGMQVLLGSTPVAVLGFGAGMGVVAFAMFRFLCGVRVFAPGQLHFGKARVLRAWQAPALWIPVALIVNAVVFVWLAR